MRGDEDWEKQARIFAALAHPARLRILGETCDYGVTPADFARLLGCSWPNVREHVRVLQRVQLADVYDSELGPSRVVVANTQELEKLGAWLAGFHMRHAR